MKLLAKVFLHLLFFMFALTGTVAAADESFTYQFLGSPLLVLVVLVVLDAIALLYHRIRK